MHVLTPLIRTGQCTLLKDMSYTHTDAFLLSQRLLALLLFTAYLIAQLGGVVYGTGEHLDELVPWRAERALQVSAIPLRRAYEMLTFEQYWYVCELFYVLSTSVLKISVSSHLHFLFRPVRMLTILNIFRLVSFSSESQQSPFTSGSSEH